jgi:selenoprotein W-related protein
VPRPRLEIEYCPRCHWLPRAAWLAQELLGTFADELGEVALRPSAEGGVFDVRLDGETIFSRRSAGRHAEASELKRIVRDRIAPGRALGHVDRGGAGDPEA